MLLVTRIHLRKELKRAKAAKQLERIALIEAVLEDGDLLELVNAANEAEYDYVRAARESAAPGVYGNPFADFLAFLFENREQIFEMIMMFVQLLSVLQPAPAPNPEA